MNKQRMKNVWVGVILSLNLILLTSCWSYRPIEDVNFVAGAALDAEKGGKISSTLQYVVPHEKGGGQAGMSGHKQYENIKEVGDALEPIGWETTLKKEGSIFGAHEKIVVIGEELARKIDMEQLVDLYYRDIDIRGSTLVFIADGKADKTLESEAPDIVPSYRINEIAIQQLSTRMLRQTSLVVMLSKMESDSSFVLQRLTTEKGEVKFDGAAVIKGKTNKLIGFLNKKEIEGLNLITGDSKTGSIRSQGKKPVYFQIQQIKSKITPYVKGENISFHLNVSIDGRIAEDWKQSFNLFKDSTLKQVEKEVEKEADSLVEHTINRMQDDLGVDIAGFGNELRIHHPRAWQRVKKDWDERFKTTPVTTNINIHITDYGMIGERNK
ncbi:Ger(x)C family spore germination protein [Fictibacillus sp. BK138]|uniref:Ger(x)C family spore germination protein n=1 Tax=Fictibacillus sp. BK138 TaxID=2512121 RepID=UPI001028BE31|nr:Ger(x)C family spore germination protein [Fictibacillus sp. BK138]RZT23584.1 spore germination protein [Fictibacillus sp. BK138]